MMKNITFLKDIFSDEDVYVIGSGPSLNFIDKSFFEGKNLIGVNKIWKYLECDYIVMKDLKIIETYQGAAKLIVARKNCGRKCMGNNKKGDYVFDHNENSHHKLPEGIIGSDKLVATYSTISSAIHLAAYMGAKNILTVGHDCCELGGKKYLENYYTKKEKEGLIKNHGKSAKEAHGVDLFEGFSNLTSELKKALNQVYRCNVYSVSPFPSFLEGMKYIL